MGKLLTLSFESVLCCFGPYFSAQFKRTISSFSPFISILIDGDTHIVTVPFRDSVSDAIIFYEQFKINICSPDVITSLQNDVIA